LTVKHVAPLRQYQAAYAGGHSYVWNVMFGRGVGAGGLGFGVVRDEHASATILNKEDANTKTKKVQGGGYFG
jgi:hypothetical protein